MSKPVAIVAAMRQRTGSAGAAREASRAVDGVELYELPSALVAIGGIGRNAAHRAAELVVREAKPGLLVSAGMAGALTPSLKPGDVVSAREVVDEATASATRRWGAMRFW